MNIKKKKKKEHIIVRIVAGFYGILSAIYYLGRFKINNIL